MLFPRMGAQQVKKSKRGTGPLKITEVGPSRGNVLLKEPIEFEPGFAIVPEKSSLGIEFDEKELKKVTVN